MTATSHPGITQVEWNGRDEGGRALPNGTYLYTLEADGVTLYAAAPSASVDDAGPTVAGRALGS